MTMAFSPLSTTLFHLSGRAACRNDTANGVDYAFFKKRFLPFREGKSLAKKFMTRVLATELGLASAEDRTTESEQVLQKAARRIPF